MRFESSATMNLVAAFLLLTPFTATYAQHVRRNLEKCLYCKILERDVLFQDGHENRHFSCMSATNDEMDGMIFPIDLDDIFAEKHYKDIQTGKTFCIPQGTIEMSPHNKINIPDINKVHRVDDIYSHKLQKNHHGRDLAVIGTKKGLFVRLISSPENNAATAFNAEQIAGKVFGLGPQAESISLTSQYNACSGGAFTVTGATEGNNVSNGVVEVYINQEMSGKESGDLENAVITATKNRVGTDNYDTYDFVMFCMPPGVEDDGDLDWVGYAYLGTRYSYYNHEYCVSLSATMHEIGHNIGFAHAGQGSNQYGDNSGYMGLSFLSSTWPQKCFNGQKYISSGWLSSDQGKTYGLSDLPVKVRLVAFADIGEELSSDAIAIKAGKNYLVYNRKKDFNKDTQEFADEVTVTRASSLSGVSYARDASLDNVGDTHNGASNISFEVCSKGNDGGLDYMWLSIHETGTASVCSNPTPTLPPVSPSPAPVPAPTPTGNSCNGKEIKVRITLDDYGSETTWKVLDDNNNQIASGGPYQNNNPVLVSENICVTASGCYTFEINDEASDGICCQYGDGSYTVEYDGQIISGGVFEDQETRTLGTCGQQPPPVSPPTSQPAPAPACEDITVTIQPDEYGSETTWELTNGQGVVVMNGGPYQDSINPSQIVEQECLASGCYTFTIYDSPYEDGLCCDYGNGWYRVDYPGQTSITGATFEASETKIIGSCP